MGKEWQDRNTIERWIEEVNSNGVNLTTWEMEFMESITSQFEAGKNLTEKQVENLERIRADRTP